MTLAPITHKQAAEYIGRHHRHCKPQRGWKFGISLRGPRGGLRGVVVVGRPVSRELDDGLTAEVLRLCTRGERNACSRLYGAARRAAAAMGYRKLVTYTLASEPGSSLRASGFVAVAAVCDRSWDTPKRRRIASGPVGSKIRWELAL